MKKNLLFLMPSLTSGGGERSLVNLLNQIDYEHYNVDLFLLNHEGLFMDLIPKEVKLLPLPESYHMFSLPLLKSLQKLLYKGKFVLTYNRLMFAIKNRMYRNTSISEQKSWKHLSVFFNQLSSQYDTAVGFMEKSSIYLCVEKVKANKKMGWIHTDYDQLGMDSTFDNPFFGKLDHIITVSQGCENIFINRFPEYSSKTKVIHNIVSPTIIRRLAEQIPSDVYELKNNEIVILSIGRLHPHKAFEMAIEACKLLIDKGYAIQWNIIGEGDERQKLTELIQLHGMDDHFNLLGLRPNPYPYIKQADFYVQTSKFEGKSIAIDEAKILNKPIVVTRFSTAEDQIQDGIDGLIVEMNAEAVSAGIEKLIQSSALREQMTETLAQLSLGTEDEIYKFYNLLV